jgi:hypothetical protein
LQTTNAVQQSGGAPGSSAAPAHVPPPMPPQLFAAPERQQVVPGVKPPEARSDLVDLMRVVNDHSESYAPQTNTRLHATLTLTPTPLFLAVAAAMGVPASVIVRHSDSNTAPDPACSRARWPHSSRASLAPTA